MKQIKVLGPGCPKCETLARNADEAAKAAGVECEIEKVKDIVDIMKFGVAMTPGLVIDGKVESVGKVLSVDKIKELLS
ncbi:MAG: thioredoxin family protein [Calditrichaeota bacterium]|jgi:small redox-active disulfide protein 2|nr:thioredoxin family protein [Calditrichota bacterium]MBT7618303.1 thioredoxin family protein [Calditrichota bacterium]MBT7788493.1 thioredoxin family protein [Calditrichota bacterium]